MYMYAQDIWMKKHFLCQILNKCAEVQEQSERTESSSVGSFCLKLVRRQSFKVFCEAFQKSAAAT